MTRSTEPISLTLQVQIGADTSPDDADFEASVADLNAVLSTLPAQASSGQPNERPTQA
jgi:hypothetical protein